MIEAPQFLVDLIGLDRAEHVTRIVLFAVMLLLTWLVLKVVARLLVLLLLKLAKRSRSTLDDRLVESLEPPLRFLIAVIGCWAAFIMLDLPQRTTQLLGNIAATLIAIGIFWALFRGADVVGGSLVEYTRNDPRVNPTHIRFGQQIAKAVILVLAFVAVMDQLGYNLNGVLAGLGLGGLAVALAAQEALSNLIGYFVIIADSPFTVGDYIKTDAATGTVEDIGFRSTRVRQQDEGVVIVPNGLLVKNGITNLARLRRRRLDFVLSLASATPPPQVLAMMQAARDMLENHPRVLKGTAFVQFVDFGGKSLDIRIICYVNEPKFEAFLAIKEDVNLRILHILAHFSINLAA